MYTKTTSTICEYFSWNTIHVIRGGDMTILDHEWLECLSNLFLQWDHMYHDTKHNLLDAVKIFRNGIQICFIHQSFTLFICPVPVVSDTHTRTD